LGAKIVLVNAEGQRRELLLEEFYLLPDKNIHRENDLRPGEILTTVVLPKLAPGSRSVHLKQGEKESFDWPIADVAVLLDCDPGGVCRQASIVLGAAAPVPHRAKVAETALRGRPVHERSAQDAAHAALAAAAPLSKNAYKLPIFETLIRRAILTAAKA
jgi:xanthine dehydrogenase YagS FAD-binding subunit